MATVPRKINERIQFYESHNPDWSASPEAVGLTAADMAALQTTTAACRAAYTLWLAARESAQAATVSLHNAMNTLDPQGSAIIGAIRNYAIRTNNPEVYAIAKLPPPKTPAPVAAPGTAYAPGVQLQQGGALELSWRCDNPPDAGGTMYEVHRQIDGGPMSQVGTTGEKKFTDSTLPAGTAAVTYTLIAVRSTKRGAPAQFNVQFGTAPAGGTTGAGTVNAEVSILRKAA
jgi:hypothetical protein